MTRVLVVKMSSMGDVIHTLPAVDEMHRNLGAGSSIDWVVEEGYAAIPRWHPAVARVIKVGLRRWRRAPGLASWRELCGYLGELRAERYDAVIDAHGLLKSAMLGALPTRGPVHGMDKGSAREAEAAFFYSRRHPIPTSCHAIDRTRQLCALALGYPMAAGPPEYGVVDARQESDLRGVVVLVPNASRPDKLWPEERWIELGRLVRAEGLLVEVTWHGDQEKERAERIAQGCDGTPAPHLELADLPAYFRHVNGMVSLDTGLSHAGAACKVPNLCLCVTTDPRLSGAWGKDQVAMSDPDKYQVRTLLDLLLDMIR